MAERMITISTDEYTQLIRSQEALEMLVDMLYNSVTLSYNDEDLCFHNVEGIMKAYCRSRYDIAYQTLKLRKEAENVNNKK